MSFMRTQALRSLQQGLRASSVRPVARVVRTQLVTKRYSSSGHGEHEASSDVPWAIGAAVVSVAGAYFLWPSASSHADAGHHDSHEESHDEPEEKEEGSEEKEDEAPADEAESKSEEPKEEKSEESKDPKEAAAGNDTSEADEKAKEDEQTAKPSGSEGESQPQGPDANKKSSKTEEPTEPVKKHGPSSVEGVRGKGMMKDDAPGMSHEVKREPDGKGGYKKRIDSGAQKDLGPGPTYQENEDGGPKRESAASSKPGFSPADTTKQGEISSKQAGMSNTPTRHSTAIHLDPEKSKKGEGTPETAKSMGTVDPNRPMAESADRGERQ